MDGIDPRFPFPLPLNMLESAPLISTKVISHKSMVITFRMTL